MERERPLDSLRIRPKAEATERLRLAESVRGRAIPAVTASVPRYSDATTEASPAWPVSM
jgi:hypothetical protein